MQAEMSKDSSSSAATSKQSEEVKQIDRDFTTNKAQVIDMLIKNVMNVNIEIPKVIKGDFESNFWYLWYLLFFNNINKIKKHYFCAYLFL